ncbi:NAD(P)H-dependent oxidoreductase [Gulosibacter sp. 10]|uniref:NAD(P)H-dependent oxidoreductase n=1 Tax=Gulosibacter sp. 10 TaxID=1255570 RepID=UPI00097F5BF3|nr:NAD(P)H-dependent oxidoreductase [Gulosibacter sp. 10]SJM71241.1 NAD(P)H oxidoreductase YRKL @ Flavodoxin 2 [Gulosibacter sp. 10]
MHALVLYAHPEADSLTASLSRRLAERIRETGSTAEIADLAGEGFDPRYSEADLAVLRGAGEAPEDIRREQERIERADAIILVHPVYWWGMPALLKGWLDRVLTFGWAFGSEDATALAGRDVHLVRLAGNAPATYDNHGYRDAIRTSVEHGVFEFVGGPVASSHLVHSAPEGLESRLDETVDALVASVAAARADALV